MDEMAEPQKQAAAQAGLSNPDTEAAVTGEKSTRDDRIGE